MRGDVDRQIRRRELDHIHDALGDIDGLVAHALEIRIDLGDGEDEAQIDSHGLLHGQQVKSSLVDLPLGGVDEALAFENHLATGEITVDIGLTGAIDRLFRQSTHAEQLLT